MGQQNYSIINLDGGLNLVDTHYTFQQKTGTCRVLDNFESDVEGGYRLVNGYSKWGNGSATQPTGTSTELLGILSYADGAIACAGTGVYFSTDGITWVQVNRDTYVAQTGTVEVTGSPAVNVAGTSTLFTTEYAVGGHIRIDGNIRKIASITDATTMTLSSEISGGVTAGTAHYKNGTTSLTGSTIDRNSQGQNEFAWLEDDGEYGSVVMSDTSGTNNAVRLKIEGSGGSRIYSYDRLDTDDFAAPANARHCCTFHQRVVLADVYEDSVRESGTVAWSDRYQNQRFDGASAGTVQVDSPVVAVRPFRDRLIIFCKNSIYQLTSINDSSNLEVRPISYNAGCAAAGSVQEFAGDLIFLSYDGIRTLSATEQFGDVQLGTISDNIDPYIKSIISSTDNLNISSCIIRYKNQYRLFYTNSGYTSDRQLGVVGTYKRNREGQFEWQWGRIKNIPVACLSTTTNPFLSLGTRDEKVFHGGFDGYVFRHDNGDDFDGSNIVAEMELNEVDYGDAGQKKTLHYVKVFGEIEGSTDDLTFQVKYDYSDSATMQPSAKTIDLDTGLPKFGTAIYGTDTYSGDRLFVQKVNVEGSGFSNNFSFSSTGTNTSYTINSLYVDLRLGVKQ